MILVTGASGFIGKHLLAALVKKYGHENVLALTSKPITNCGYLLHNDYNFAAGLFAENNYAALIDTIIHAGAFTPKNSTQANQWHLCNSNITNTIKLLAVELPNLKKVVYLSTLDVYANADVVSESSTVAPVSLYGHSKLYTEKMLMAWAASENKISQVLRIGHVYGPGEEAYQKIIPVTMKNIINDSPVQLWGDGAELRAFIYIDDVINAIVQSVTLQGDAGPVNIVSDNSVSIKNLVNKIMAISGKSIPVETRAATAAGRNLVFDNRKMKEYFGAEKTFLDEGLKQEWDYMQNLSA